MQKMLNNLTKRNKQTFANSCKIRMGYGNCDEHKSVEVCQQHLLHHKILKHME